MVGWLESWLREIVLVVLFAVVTDMLLPNNKMQRYIRVVVSLFVLLTILNPIITLIRSDFHFREVEAGLDQWSSRAASASKVKSLSEIAEDAEKLRDISERQTDQWIEQRLSEMIWQDLREQGYANVKQVRARAALEPSGHAVISEVQVYLLPEKVESQATSEENKSESAERQTGAGRGEQQGDELVRPIAPVKPFEPIRVEIDWSSRQTAEPVAAQSHDEQAATGTLERTIRNYLVEQWGVAPERIVFQSDPLRR